MEFTNNNQNNINNIISKYQSNFTDVRKNNNQDSSNACALSITPINNANQNSAFSYMSKMNNLSNTNKQQMLDSINRESIFKYMIPSPQNINTQNFLNKDNPNNMIINNTRYPGYLASLRSFVESPIENLLCELEKINYYRYLINKLCKPKSEKYEIIKNMSVLVHGKLDFFHNIKELNL